jgi:hypothetical protein
MGDFSLPDPGLYGFPEEFIELALKVQRVLDQLGKRDLAGRLQLKNIFIWYRLIKYSQTSLIA